MHDVPVSQRVTPASFRVNNLHVDSTIGLVSGARGSVRLEPRVMDVLLALAQRPGELVSRAELLSAIWPGGTTYDEALTQSVYQLRQQLISAGGDECRQIVTTVPKRGYLLNAEVRPIVPDPAEAPAPAVRKGRRHIWAAVIVLSLLAVWAVMQWTLRPEPIPTRPQPQTIAVLPFLPLEEAERDPVLELGMADTLVARLSGIPHLTVRPISSVRWFTELDRDVLAAGRRLDVDVVVDGSIQRSGDIVRVTARLLRVRDGTALWAETFNERFSGIFALQDAISERVTSALSVTLDPREQASRTHGGTSSSEAYGRYLQGRYHLARLTPADLLASIEHFRAAVALDPRYAQAWLGLASAQFRIPIAGEAPPRAFYPLAKQAAQNALQLDPALAEGHAMLGWIAVWYEWDWDASEVHFRRAIELNPNDTESHLGYALLLSGTGRHAEALDEVRRARELSPLYLVAAALEGGFLLRANRIQDAIQRLEQARTLDPGFWLVRMNLAGAYFLAGRPEDALSEARTARQTSGGSTWAMANEIAYLARLDRLAEANTLLADLRERSAERYVPPYDLAVAHEAVGDLDAAIAWLERAYEARDPKMTFLGEGTWQQLRDRPEYAALMVRMDLARFFE